MSNIIKAAKFESNTELFAHTCTALGSTNTVIPFFTTIVTNVNNDSDWTIENTAANGLSVTINNPGWYHFAFSWGNKSGADNEMGISLNASSLITSISALAAAERVAYNTAHNVVTDQIGKHVNAVINCAAGDIVRPHCNLNLLSQSILAIFRAMRLR